MGEAEVLQGFAPLARPEARVLVLGSMPSAASLQADEYYGHSRNAFWWIMGELFGAGPKLSYAKRVAVLTAAGVAVWDVLAACRRQGSLDSAIEADSERPNDFAGFLEAHPRIGVVCFNGAKAEQVWKRHVAPRLREDARVAERVAALDLLRLPSTSPAHASLDRSAKLAEWRALAASVQRLCGSK